MVKKVCPKCGGDLVRDGNHYVCSNCLRRIALDAASIGFDSNNPLDRLERQYVEGLITREDYLEKKKILLGY
jgi:predicted amidophosphoribosyltransferase